MKLDCNYYKKYIKPIEKKYTLMCILYNKFKLKYFKDKMNLYNEILINHYQIILYENK